MRNRHVLAIVMVAGALAAIGVGVHAISLRFVEWGEPLPWEDGKPYVARIEGAHIAAGTMVLLGPTVVGRASHETHNGGRVLRIDRKLKLGRDSRFELHAVDATRSVVIIPGRDGRLEPWDEITVEAPPSRNP